MDIHGMTRILSAALLVLAAGHAGAAALSLLPVDGLYGIADGDQGARSHIHPDFVQAIGYGGEAPMPVNGVFREAMRQGFGGSLTDTITPQNKYRTYAASLQVVRADQYAVNRPDGNVDIYLPLTLNLYFTNILTGEVLYSKSATSYGYLTETQEQYAAGASRERIAASYSQGAATLVRKLVNDAAGQFNPLAVEALILRQWEGFTIIDKGMDAGIGLGVELLTPQGSGLKIIHTEPGYAVGIPTLGEISVKDTLSLYSTAANKDIRKPKVLVMDADTPEGLSGQFASIQFSENIGNKAAFTVVPVNPTYQAVLQQIVRNGGLQQAEITQRRELPDYFIRIKILPPQQYELATNQNFGKQRVFSDTAFAELVDQNGRVLYSTSASSEIQDQIIEGGMAFDINDRHKVLFSNLLDTLSHSFIANVRFNHEDLPIQQVDENSVTITDAAGRLSIGQNIHLFRSLPGEKGFPEFQVPLWELQAEERQGQTIKASYLLPFSDGRKLPASKNDFIRVDGSTANTPSSMRIAPCGSAQDKGTIPARYLTELGYFNAGALLTLPYYGAEFPVSPNKKTLSKELESLQHAGFAKPLQISSITPTYCLEPLAKVDQIKRECDDKRRLCEISVQIMAGWQAKPATGTAPIRSLQRIESRFENIPIDSAESYVARRVMDKILELMPQTLRQVEKELVKP